MSTPAVTLTAYNMGSDVTEEDFDRWVTYVNDHIDAACGFSVEVEQGPFSGKGVLFEDHISGCTEDQTEAVTEALRAFWEKSEW